MLQKDANQPRLGVDVAVPCYQYGQFLRDCVTSVLTQGFRDVRVLIIDNASTDESAEVAQQLAAEDHRVEVVLHRRNLGHHASYNEGIDWASSKYFMMLDADDLLAPGCLARAVAIMEQHPDVGFAYGGAISFGPGDPLPVIAVDTPNTPWRIVGGEDLLERFCRTALYFGIHGTSTMVIRTVAQKRAGYYRPELPSSDDLEMWMRLARLGPAAETDVIQGIKRIHGSSRGQFTRRDHTSRLLYDEAAFESFFAHEGALLPEAARLHRLARRSLGARAYWSALAHLCRGQASMGRDLLRFAIRLYPTTAILPPLPYLLRRHDAVRRIFSVVCETVGRPRTRCIPQ